MMMMRSLLLLFLTALSTTHAMGGAEYEAGTAVDKVVALTKASFKLAMQDSANPFFLLKFYAPWCGHCKRLAPVLDKVAKQTANQMAIATIDCTVEKTLCAQHGVRGYPTLKFSLDGQIYDYPGGRSEKDFLEFSKRMLRPIVETVASVEEAHAASSESEQGVAFLVYHPAVVEAGDGATIDEMLQLSRVTQVYAQAARNERATGTFLLLDTSGTQDDEAAAAVAASMGQDGDAFFCRLEANVEPRCFGSMGEGGDGVQFEELLSWVKEQNVPTVAALGANNFKDMTRRGRPLCVAVVKTPSGIETAKLALTEYALNGPEKIREKYYFAWIDGKQWGRFLEQFEVFSKDSPQVFLLDMPHRKYGQNATYKLNVDDFLQAVEVGTIEMKRAGKSGVQGFLAKFYNMMVYYRPYSVMAVVLLVVAMGALILSCIKPGQDLRPPYPREELADDKKKSADSSKKDETKDKEEKSDDQKNDEGKKDK